MKLKKLILAICFCFGLGNLSTVHAASYFSSNGPRWARSTEQYQLSYFGEAFTKTGQGRAAVTYKRNHRIIGNATAAIVNPSQLIKLLGLMIPSILSHLKHRFSSLSVKPY